MTFEGNITEIIFRNQDNGYTVGNMKTPEGEITFVGTFLAINEGESLVFEGRIKDHPIYGQQVEVLSYKLPDLNTDKSIFNYLSAGNIDEIGPKMAERIVNKFGDKTLDIFDNDPERLLEVEGIGPKKFNKIITSYQARAAQRTLVVRLASYDINPSLAMKIYRHFGSEAMAILQENPYLLASKVRGMGFLKADEIAMKMGMEKDSSQRLQEGLKYVLGENTYRGDTYMTLESFKAKAGQLLGSSLDKLEEAIYELAIKKEIILEEAEVEVFGQIIRENRVYLDYIHDCEGEIAYRLLELIGREKPDSHDRDSQLMVKEAEDKLGKKLEKMQKEAVIRALDENVMVLTGGPGTGKTTIISFIISCFENLDKEVKLCAPTGRAAKRMSEATGKKAMTIHRILEVGYTGDEEENFYNRDESNPLETDVLIVDEVSMVDIFLMRALLRALPKGASIIFVGDKDQLPSVGLGKVLQDMIDSQVINTVTLSEIFRQSQESSIIVNAHRVKEGQELDIKKGSQDFFFMHRRSQQEVQDLVVDLVAKRLPDYYKIDPREIQVLAPIKKTPSGVHDLNVRLQEAINPEEGKREFKHLDRIIRVGDKIMQIKNNYEKE